MLCAVTSAIAGHGFELKQRDNHKVCGTWEFSEPYTKLVKAFWQQWNETTTKKPTAQPQTQEMPVRYTFSPWNFISKYATEWQQILTATQIKLESLVTFGNIGKLGSLRQVLQKWAVKSEWNSRAKASPADFCLRKMSASTQLKQISAWFSRSPSFCNCSADWFLSGVCFLWWIWVTKIDGYRRTSTDDTFVRLNKNCEPGRYRGSLQSFSFIIAICGLALDYFQDKCDRQPAVDQSKCCTFGQIS